MFSHSRARSDGLGGAGLGLEDLRAQALTYLIVALGGIAWALNLSMPALTGSVEATEQFFLSSLWLLGIAACGWVVLRYSVTIAGTVVAGATTALVAFAAIHHPTGSLLGLLALVVVGVVAVSGPRHGFVWALITSLVAVLVHPPTGPAESESALVIVTLIWGSALVAWLGARPVYVTADWAWSHYRESMRLSQELRVHRGELVRLLKSLTEAYERLERQDAALQHAVQAANHARRMKAEFAAAISHELRTPMNLILGVSEIMMEAPSHLAGESLPPSIREDVEVIYRNACHISHLIDDVLDLSQVDAHRMGLQKEPVHLANVIERAISVVSTLFEHKGLYLRATLPDNLPIVRADPVRLRQVLINLLTNATRFTDVGGVTVSACRAERHILISVADTGVGIAADALPHVFEEFYQPDQAGTRTGGSGLGLTISQRIIELHGGKIKVESVADQGSTFSFSLPITEVATAPPAEFDLPAFVRRADDGDARTLAVVGDDAPSVRLLQRYLDDFQIVAAPTREQVRRDAQENRLDAVVVTTPDALADFRQLRSDLPSIPVIYCPIRTTRTLAREAGVADYLVKPVTTEQLAASLRRLHRRIRSVLVVDDDPEMRRMLARMVCLGRRNRTVMQAANGVDALQCVYDRQPDVILLDLIMPDMDGYGFLQALHATRLPKRIPVVVITAKGHERESVVADELVIGRGKGLTVGEFTQALRASLNSLSQLGPWDASQRRSSVSSASRVTGLSKNPATPSESANDRSGSTEQTITGM